MPMPQVTLLNDAFTGADGTALATYDAHYVTSLLGTTKTAQLLTNKLRLAGADGSYADVFRFYRDDFNVCDLDATWEWAWGGENETYPKMMARGPSGWGTTWRDGPAFGTAALAVSDHPVSGGPPALLVTLHHNDDTYTDIAFIPVSYVDGDVYGHRWRLTGGLSVINLWDITAAGTLATSTPYAVYEPSGETIGQYGRFAHATTYGAAVSSRTLDIDNLVVKTHGYGYPYPVMDRGFDVSVSAGTTTTISLVLPTSIAVGDYLFAFVAVDNAGASGTGPGLTVTDSASNTWTVSFRFNKTLGVANDGTTGYLCYTKVTTAYQVADSVLFTWGVSVTAKAIVLQEWANVHPTTPLFNIAEASGTGTAVAVGAPTSPNAQFQVALAMVAIEGPGADTYTPTADTIDGAWAVVAHAGGANGTATNNQSVAAECKVIEPASGWSGQTYAPTLGTSRDWVGHMVFVNPDDTQIVVPDGELTATGWTTAGGASSPLFAQVDEVPADDTNYAKATLA